MLWFDCCSEKCFRYINHLQCQSEIERRRKLWQAVEPKTCRTGSAFASDSFRSRRRSRESWMIVSSVASLIALHSSSSIDSNSQPPVEFPRKVPLCNDLKLTFMTKSSSARKWSLAHFPINFELQSQSISFCWIVECRWLTEFMHFNVWPSIKPLAAVHEAINCDKID